MCVERCQSKIEDLELGHIITATHENLYTIEYIEEKFHVVYTSAVVEPVFTLKTLYLALQCKNVQYLFFNHGHCMDIFLNLREVESFQQLIVNRSTLVDAKLGKDPGADDSQCTERWIYALELNKYVFNNS